MKNWFQPTTVESIIGPLVNIHDKLSWHSAAKREEAEGHRGEVNFHEAQAESKEREAEMAESLRSKIGSLIGR